MIKVGRCSVYEASQVLGVDTKTIEDGCCAGALMFMDTRVKQFNPNLNYMLMKFWSVADDFCGEEIMLG